MRNNFFGALTVATALLLASCGGSGGNTSDSSSENPLSATFPEDLVVTSPFAVTTTSPASVSKSLVKATDSADYAGTGELKPFSERKQEIHDQIIGTKVSDCEFSFDLFKAAPESNCYGPNISYYNHPNATEQDLILGRESGTLPGGDTGIWAEYDFNPASGSTGEACAASKLNNLISNVTFKVDTAINMFSGMLCMAKVDGLTALPAVGESKDLKASLAKAVASVSGVTIDAATIERQANTADSKKVYLSHVQTTIALSETYSAIMDVYLKHIPLSDDNTTYKGKLWYKITSEKGKLPAMTPNCGWDDDNASLIGSSLIYNKPDANTLQYHVRSAAYCDTSLDPFDAHHNVDPSADWAGNFTYGIFELNPSNGTGKVSFAWQAGPTDNATRTFIADISTSGNTTSGCGYFGYGPDIAAEEDVGSIQGFICNWAGPGSFSSTDRSRGRLDLAQQQCISKDATSGKFVPTETHMTYAPTLNCNVEADQVEFTYWSGFGGDNKTAVPEDIANNDKREDTTTAQHDLVDVSLVPAPPALPADIE